MQNTAEVKAAVKKSGMSRLEVAQAIDMPYGTLTYKLGGYSPFTDEEAAQVLGAIEKNRQGVGDAE